MLHVSQCNATQTSTATMSVSVRRRSGFSCSAREGRGFLSFLRPVAASLRTSTAPTSSLGSQVWSRTPRCAAAAILRPIGVTTWFGGIAGVAFSRMVVLAYRLSPVPSRSPSLFPSFPLARFLHLCRCLPLFALSGEWTEEIILVSIVLQEHVLRSVGVPQVRFRPE